jgi:phosphoribosylformimino-5-aminoimidazole carboxamide ribotide isomerase
MELYCALDVLEGRAVRLVRGDFAKVTDYGDPLSVAGAYLAAGARWLHVVDLDAARSGRATNAGIVRAVLDAAHEHGARVQVGGGLRTDADVDALLDAGADRVVLGTAAVADPAFARAAGARHPGRVAVGLDYRRRGQRLESMVEGWTARGAALDALVGAVSGGGGGAPPAAGVCALVVTAVERDGTLQGPDTEGLGGVLDATTLAVVASGGARSAGDLRHLGAFGSPAHGRRVAGVVVGRALLERAVDVEEALAACEASG